MVGKRKGSNLGKSPAAEWGKALERSTSTHMDTQVHNLTHVCTPYPRLSPWQQTPPPPSDALLASGYKSHGAVGAWL